MAWLTDSAPAGQVETTKFIYYFIPVFLFVSLNCIFIKPHTIFLRPSFLWYPFITVFPWPTNVLDWQSIRTYLLMLAAALYAYRGHGLLGWGFSGKGLPMGDFIIIIVHSIPFNVSITITPRISTINTTDISVCHYT